MLRRFLSTSKMSIRRSAVNKKATQLVAQKKEGIVSLLHDASTMDKPDVQVLFVPKCENLVSQIKEQTSFPICRHALSDFQADLESTIMLYPFTDDMDYEKKRLLLVGIGDSDKVNGNCIRKAVHCAVTKLRQHDVKNALLETPELKSVEKKCLAEWMSQASMLSNYRFDKYMTENIKCKTGERKIAPVDKIYLNLDESFTQCVEEQVVVAQETIFARNLGEIKFTLEGIKLLQMRVVIGNERADVVTPEFMQRVAMECLELPNVEVNILQQCDLAKEGMNLFISVGQAATIPPRLVILKYQGNPNATSTVGLVGKGITFDTGGLNLKPTGSIEDMHSDMCGAAAVLGAFRAAARMELKVNLVCALAMAENAIGSKAVKPHAIVQASNGITVEISNTDAEGRLVLADTLSYVQKVYKPTTVIDAATLTGACVVALGEYAAGVFSNNSQLARQIEDCGKACFERCWPLPIFPEHTAELKGFQSDSRSTGKGRYGGSSVAAAFLQQFIDENVAWAHLDIAGPAYYSEARSYFPRGATGFGVQLLYRFLKQQQ